MMMVLCLSCLVLLTLLPLSLQEPFQCDLDNAYMLGDIAIPTVIDSEPLFQDDYSKILTPDQEASESLSRNKRAAVKDRSRIWPDNTIPYVIDKGFNGYYVSKLKRAMRTWEEVSCIKFVSRTTEEDYIHINPGRRCCSFVGRLKKGGQKLTLDTGCMVHGILLHEFGHVIGFWHEQNRPDRDQYIKVLDNFHESKRYNFAKMNESLVHDYGVPYDYSSIMHYGETFFSVDGKSSTLIPLQEGVEIGQRITLSPMDILQTNRLYMCQKECSWTYNASESAGSFQSMNYPENYPPKTNCITIIEANEEQVITLTFETIDIEHHADCTFDYLEVRDGNLPTASLLGKFCGNLPPKNFTSSGPSLWVKFHSDTSVSETGFFAHFVAFDKDSARASKIDPCELKTCLHDCVVIGGYATCTCAKGFRLNKDGYTCSDLNECKNNNGGCSHICMNSYGLYSCMCPRGYILGENGRTCEDIDECETGHSDCTQLCTNTPGSYYCDCNPGYDLSRDHVTCMDLDECRVNNGGCAHICQNSPGGRVCRCSSGYVINPSDETICLDVDECELDNGGCDQDCVNKVGSHQCVCFPGFTLDSTRSRCIDLDECNDGDNGGCQHFCHDLPGSHFCSCRTGFVLDTLTQCKDVNECETRGIQCTKGWCVNDPGSYHCSCSAYHIIHPRNPHLCILGLSNEEDNLTEDTNYGLLMSTGRQNYIDPVCRGQDVMSGEPGTLTSPFYPLPYPTDTKCTWLVSGRDDEHVQFTILDFDVEKFAYCRYDSLRIFDGRSEEAPFLANLCGTLPSQSTITSNSSNLLLKFTSDAMQPRLGFKATVDFLWETCGGRYAVQKQSRSIIWSGSEGSQCLWSLTAPRGSNIFLKFVTSQFTGKGWPRTRCGVDETIEIYNTERRTLLTSFCRGSLPPKLYIAPVSKITVVARFLSDGSSADLLILFSATSLNSIM